MSEQFVRGVFGRYSGIFALLGGLTVIDGILVPYDVALFADILGVVALVMLLPCIKCVVVWRRHQHKKRLRFRVKRGIIKRFF
ncbi:hypothetical protein HY641_00480 [Candidatus Woesearchaeota archaeon]|nr:hypothetical protein [Candidatus Woesearchaeota archaeon]